MAESDSGTVWLEGVRSVAKGVGGVCCSQRGGAETLCDGAFDQFLPSSVHMRGTQGGETEVGRDFTQKQAGTGCCGWSWRQKLAGGGLSLPHSWQGVGGANTLILPSSTHKKLGRNAATGKAGGGAWFGLER